MSAVLLGYDTELTYQKLEDCCILLGRGADYIATHPDMVCPTWYGSAPDCGSFIEMLFTATGRRPKILGKPQPDMALAAMRRTGYAPEQTCILGDRIYTDIACGVNAGIDAVFLLSGEGVMADKLLWDKMSQSRVWGGSPASVVAARRDAKIASVATLALLAVSASPGNPTENGGSAVSYAPSVSLAFCIPSAVASMIVNSFSSIVFSILSMCWRQSLSSFCLSG